MDITPLDILGMSAGIIVALSLSMSDPVKLRSLNTLGAILFIIHGALLVSSGHPAWPYIIFNFWIVGANAWFLRKAFLERRQST